MTLSRKQTQTKKFGLGDRVDMRTLPNIEEIVAASFEGEAVKAEVIAKECEQFILSTNVEEISCSRREIVISECDNLTTNSGNAELAEQLVKLNRLKNNQ